MKHKTLLLGFRRSACLLMLMGVCCAVGAQSTRTWVSGVGDDANPCSRTAPCLTIAGALAKTVSGGEIDALDESGFETPSSGTPSTLVITQPVIIDGGGGQVAGLGAVPNGDSIVINLASPALGTVVLRSLSLNGFAGSGANGIRISSGGNIVLDGVAVSGYANACLLVDSGGNGAVVDAMDSSFANCATGVSNNAAASVNLDGTDVTLNTTVGVISSNPLGAVSLFNSSATNNATNVSQAKFVGQTPPFGSSATPGSASAAITGGQAGCSFASAEFVSPSAAGGVGLPPGLPPAASAFQFTTTPCGSYATVNLSVTFDQTMPPGTQLYKFGPATPGAANSTWFVLPGAVLSVDGRTFTYSVTDNGVGDSNSTLGIITDPVAPVLPLTSIPTLSPLGLLMLAGAFAILGLYCARRKS